MTVPSDENRAGPYHGNNVTKVFGYGFKITDASHLRVIIRDDSGNERTLVLNTDYMVSGVGVDVGGSVTTTVAPIIGEDLTILRDVPFVQDTDLENQGAYYAETVEDALDLAVMRDQQLKEGLDRAVKMPENLDPSGLNDLIADIIRLGASANNIDTVANIAPQVVTVASIDDEIVVVAGIHDKITTVAGIAPEVTAVAAVASDIPTVAANVTDITNFADVYQGPKTANPTTRNDGSPLQPGDLYFNTTTDVMKVRTSAGEWADASVLSLNMTANSFVGNGAQTAFVLTAEPGVAANVIVWVGGVRQKPGTDYTVAGSTLTMAVAPGNGVQVDTLVVTTISKLNVPADASVTPASLKDADAKGFRMAANVRGRVNFFDFLQATRSAAVREQIMNGTFTGDLGVEWQQFRDALAAIEAAGGTPHGFIPECTIYSSAVPNFAIQYLTLETQGQPTVIGIGGAQGFMVNGSGLGPGGYGISHISVGPLKVGSQGAASGAIIKMAHRSQFDCLMGLGASSYGIYVDSCVSSAFRRLKYQAQYTTLTDPTIGLYVTGSDPLVGATSWCSFELPITEWISVGMRFDASYGNLILGGTSESCSSTGLVLGTGAEFNKFIGIDFENNTDRDVFCQGGRNEFYSVDSAKEILFSSATARGNKIFGGHHKLLSFGAGTTQNLVTGANVETITDASTGVARNRFSSNYDNAGNWHDRFLTWTSPVSATSGSITTANANGQYKVRDGDAVDFDIEVLITNGGTGTGAVIVTLPFNVATNAVFSGVEIASTGKVVSGYALTGSNSLSLRFADGSYPGASNSRIVVSGTYRRA